MLFYCAELNELLLFTGTVHTGDEIKNYFAGNIPELQQLPFTDLLLEHEWVLVGCL